MSKQVFKAGDKVRLTGPEWGLEGLDMQGSTVTILRLTPEGFGVFQGEGEWEVEPSPDDPWGGEIVEFSAYSHTWTGNPNATEDLINDPSHYRQGGIAVHEVLDAYGLDQKHYLASATEYILRSGFKGTEESDLRKAVWHLNHYIEQHFGGDDED